MFGPDVELEQLLGTAKLVMDVFREVATLPDVQQLNRLPALWTFSSPDLFFE
jgi:hypothetical protein